MALKFRGVDFIEFDTLLSEDELLVRDKTRKFVEDNLIPIIEECFREGRFPRELVQPMGELGFFGANLKGYGCAGMSNVEYGLVMQELERGDQRPAQFRQRAVGAGDVSDLRLRLRRAERASGCPRLQAGEKLGCFGLTEPDFGSNPGGMTNHAPANRATSTSSTARRCGSPPAPSPMSPSSGPSAKTTKGQGSRISGRDRPPGFSADDVHGKWSLRASVTIELSPCRMCMCPAPTCCRRAKGLKSAADVPEPGALRHRLGRASAQPWPATTRRCNTPKSASNFTISPSPSTSSSRKNSSG